jgi:hypothetical protein
MCIGSLTWCLRIRCKFSFKTFILVMSRPNVCRQPKLAFREVFLPYFYDAKLKVDMKLVEG